MSSELQICNELEIEARGRFLITCGKEPVCDIDRKWPFVQRSIKKTNLFLHIDDITDPLNSIEYIYYLHFANKHAKKHTIEKLGLQQKHVIYTKKWKGEKYCSGFTEMEDGIYLTHKNDDFTVINGTNSKRKLNISLSYAASFSKKQVKDVNDKLFTIRSMVRSIYFAVGMPGYEEAKTSYERECRKFAGKKKRANSAPPHTEERKKQQLNGDAGLQMEDLETMRSLVSNLYEYIENAHLEHVI